MKTFGLILGLFISGMAFGQEDSVSIIITEAPQKESPVQTIFSKDIHSSGYLAAVTKLSWFQGDAGLLVGGQIAWVANRRLGIGLAGYGLTTPIDLSNDNSGYPELEMGYGGLLIEPIIASNQAVHVEFPIIVGAGGIGHYERIETETAFGTNISYRLDYSKAFFVAEPGVNVVLNVNKFTRFGIGGTYRFTKDINDLKQEIDGMNDFSLAVSLKFGLF